MDPQKPEDSTTARATEYADKPLGRGLADISHLFLSQRTPEAAGRERPPARLPERTPIQSQPGSQARTVLLQPGTSLTRAALVALLKEVQDALERGLRVIDAHIPCHPYGEIDLLALDRMNQLTIIDFDTAPNDGLLLRGLGHFDWMLDNLPIVRRMHPGQIINLSSRPRLFLLAPRFSPLITSIARHLIQPEINCVRYHVVEQTGAPGVLFEPVTAE